MRKISDKRVGILGYGNMGSAIAERIKFKYALQVYDKDVEKVKNLADVKVAESVKNLADNVEIIILAVKPQDFDNVLNQLKSSVQGKLIISIAAGIETGYIEKILTKARVVRVMPNLGAKIAEAESTLCKGRSATGDDLNLADELFKYLGKTWQIKELLINSATAICGSGPAYIFYDMEKNNINAVNISKAKVEEYKVKLITAATDKEIGFDMVTASSFAGAVTGTSIDLVRMTGLSPKELRKQVTSPGGTTEAALNVLFTGGSWTNAAIAAKKRAEELAKKE